MGNCSRRQPRTAVIWQVELSDDYQTTWLDYEGHWYQLLEAAYQYTRSRPWMCHMVELENLEWGTIDYEVDLRFMVQIQPRTGTQRRVRRLVMEV